MIVLTLFSCVIFSACGDKYKNLSMSFYSTEGEVISELNFIIDPNFGDATQKVGVKFSGIDKDEIGQVVFYPSVDGMVSISNYSYSGDTCFVDVTPNFASSRNAKLIVSHLASGKKQYIDLNIEQKSNNLIQTKNNYIISRPTEGTETKQIDFSQLVALKPEGSTDRIYFKIASGEEQLDNYSIEKIKAFEDLNDNIYSGFKVGANTSSLEITIYPVTYMPGANYEIEEHSSKLMTIKFINTLNKENVMLEAEEGVNLQELKLIANCEPLSTYCVGLNVFGTLDFNGSDYVSLYDVETEVVTEKAKISAVTDSNKDIHITASAHTQGFVEVKVKLKPKNCVGEIETVEKSVFVKGELCAEDIEVTKNGNLISLDQPTNIFDYYTEEGANSLGSLFKFKPVTDKGDVHKDLRTMRIMIEPEILFANATKLTDDIDSNDNIVYNEVYTDSIFTTKSDTNDYKSGEITKTVNSTQFSLLIHIGNDPMKFYYDSSNGVMVSEEFDETSRIYIKYVKGGGEYESIKFGLEVQVINKSPLINWQNLELANITVDFIRVKGVKSMDIQAGSHTAGAYTYYAENENPECVYLNRLDGATGNIKTISYFIDIVNDSVIGADKTKLITVDFEVEISSLQTVENPLTICAGVGNGENNIDGLNDFVLTYYSAKFDDVVGIVLKNDTSIGDYKISFYQEGIEKASVICRVFEGLGTLDKTMIKFETNSTAFKNEEYKDSFNGADYIVASGQNLNIALDLKDEVLNSSIVKEYAFSFNVKGVTTLGESEKKQYFDFKQDNLSFNFANLEFRKGTIIGDSVYYVELTITPKVVKYDNIVTVSANLDDSKNITVSFYIYNKINKSEISINHTSMTRYMYDWLEVNYKDYASSELKIEMDDDLWKYVSQQKRYVLSDNNTGEYLKLGNEDKYVEISNYEKDESGNLLIVDGKAYEIAYNTYNIEWIDVQWKVDNFLGVSLEEDVINRSVDLTFTSIDQSQSNYFRTIKAYIYQFNDFFEFECVFYVEKPVLTEKLIINSDLKMRETEGREYYINLKKGQSYTVLAQNVAENSNVTHKDVVIQVVANGSALGVDNYFTINGTSITVDNIPTDRKNFKLVVLARDALKIDANSITSYGGFDNPSSFLSDLGKGKHKGAYFVIEIDLSDGSETHPYQIYNDEDFWEINDSDEYKNEDIYYVLMTNLTLNYSENQISPITNFNAHIRSYAEKNASGDITKQYKYTINGIKLNATNKNLFTNFGGEITSVNFEVYYDYNITEKNLTKVDLGLFDVNNGILTNVSIQVAGNANLSAITATDYNFGGLVGVNNGKILYSQGIGARGKINSLSNNGASVFFGGLVGTNYGDIIGAVSDTDSQDNKIVLSVAGQTDNTTSSIEINSTLSVSASVDMAIGGVVGRNGDTSNPYRGTFKNILSKASIIAENSSNVGGVIGINYGSNSLNVTLDSRVSAIENVLTEDLKNASIYNVKSATTIKAKDNVGGIVGKDTNGLYIECDYQILVALEKSYAIQGNNNIGGIAGYSQFGQFMFCSVMSYNWKYSNLKDEEKYSQVVNNVADIVGVDYVGGIVGFCESNNSSLSSGDNSVSDRVIIAYSSVNAYLKATKQNEELENIGNVGGIACLNTNIVPIIFNVYYIGMLEGYVVYTDTTANGNVKSLCLTNVVHSSMNLWNAVYSINLEKQADDSYIVKVGNVKDGQEFEIDYSENSLSGIADYWWWNAAINSGFTFITNDTNDENLSKLPIFDISPDSIEVTVNDEDEEELQKVLQLEYYDFTIGGIGANALADLNVIYNRSDLIMEKLNIVARPEGLGEVVINVRSSNTRVVDVTFDGKIFVNGIGECELIFSSVVNPEIKDTITVIVDYPIGDSFVITTSKTDPTQKIEDEGELRIPKDSSKQLYVLTSGKIEEDLDENSDIEEYIYKTKTDFNLKVEITGPSGENIQEYLSISGIVEEIENPNDPSTSTILLDKRTPFSISVLKYLNLEHFDFKVTPYKIINNKEVDENDKYIEFELYTQQGATDISFSFDEAIVYPNDTIYVNAIIKTDYEYLKTDLNNILTGDTIHSLQMNLEGLDKSNYDIEIIDSSYNENTLIQVVSFKIEFKDIEISDKTTFLFEMSSNTMTTEVQFIILPQRIDKIEVKNYYYQNEGTKDSPDYVNILDNVLKPDHSGFMILDIVPNNGYYDYLEISDLTGNEEIWFTQVESIKIEDDEHGKAIQTDNSSDGKGIRLNKLEDNESRLYVVTQIDRTYSSKLHTIEIRAYVRLSEGNSIIVSKQTYAIDVKMLPEITVEYVLPNGQVGVQAETANNVPGGYLANGVDASFIIKETNTNVPLEITLEGTMASSYEVIHDVGNHYVLKFKGEPNHALSNVGETVKVNFKTGFELDNGAFETAECSIQFEIVSFVIHSVSVNQSNTDSNGNPYVYGYYDKEYNLRYYFDKDDISYYNEDEEIPFWNTVYEKFNGNASELTALPNSLQQIYAILDKLNSYDNSGENPYLILNNNEKDNNKYKEETTVENITLLNNKLKVQENYQPNHLAIQFTLYKNASNIWNIDSGNECEYVVATNYQLRFNNATPWYEPEIITTEEQFKGMEDGKRYILANDLTLNEHVPITAKLTEFDGNGRTITIKGFGLFNNANIQAGLFNQVWENMIVKNVKVVYENAFVAGEATLGYINSSSKINYYDLCNNKESVNYTSASFGGIASINNGIITNCEVGGLVALRATDIEEKKYESGSGYRINFNIGALVAENTEKGYITHSTSRLNIFSQSNVAGFVNNNSGKIVSCGVESDSTIYSYNSYLANTVNVSIAGFAIENSGEISMSYVNLRFDSSKNESYGAGLISAKDESAGFVYSNSGIIYDAFVQMTNVGRNNNVFAGFVYSNSEGGRIERSYVSINDGVKAQQTDSMFAPVGTTGLIDCIEFVSSTNGYTSGIESGLTTYRIANVSNLTCYKNHNFAFGDNVSAVWKSIAGYAPQLVSTLERVQFDGSGDYDGLLSFSKVTKEVNGESVETYEVNFANYGTKENPYIIHDLETWNLYMKLNEEFHEGNVTYSYYRIVKDIDFSTVGNNPVTSNITFKGNIQGNNMHLANFMLYSNESLDSLGLFKEMKSAKSYEIVNAVRNLKLSVTTVWASSTKAVGILAGIIEDFNIYNISVTAGDVMVGRNAIGGVAGLVRGAFDIDYITSSVSVNSSRESILNRYSVYMSKNNKESVSNNLSNVYYAGSVVGILDGYDSYVYDINSVRNLNNKFFKVSNIFVNGSVVAIGDTVGSAFGFVGERVYAKNIKVNTTGRLSGVQYSGGAVGENRGVVDNVTVVLADNTFVDSKHVSAGVVGLNMGGLVRNVTAQVNINKTSFGQSVGGIVGRNIYGVVQNAYFDGELFAYITGGIVGTNYDKEVLLKTTSGNGALSDNCRACKFLIPQSEIEYVQSSTPIINFSNVSISNKTLNYLIANLSKYYSYTASEDTNATLDDLTSKTRVLGLIIGASYSDFSTAFKDLNIYLDETNEKIVFNGSENSVAKLPSSTELILMGGTPDDIKFTFKTGTKIIPMDVGEIVKVVYLTGTLTSQFDSYSNYSEDYVLFGNIS